MGIADWRNVVFNPLGDFNPAAQLDKTVFAKAKTLLESLPDAPTGSLSRVYLHWTGLPFGRTVDAYNGLADFRNGEWSLALKRDPRDNAGLTDTDAAAHTWRRNRGAVGVAVSGMSAATENDFGPDALTSAGLDHLCAAAAAFAYRYGINPLGTVERSGEFNILTHAECARIDGYLCGFTSDPDCRWDLGSLVALPDGTSLTEVMVSQCGDALRHRVQAYAIALGFEKT